MTLTSIVRQTFFSLLFLAIGLSGIVARAEDPAPPKDKDTKRPKVRVLIKKTDGKLVDPKTGKEIRKPSTKKKPVKRKPPPAPKTLAECRKAFHAGRYAPAATGFAKLVEAGTTPVQAAIGQADALAIMGKYSNAQKALEAVTAQGEKQADWHLAMAEALQHVGQYTQALEHVTQSRAIRSDWAPSLFLQGELLETLGRKKEAIAIYKSMDVIVEGEEYLT